MYLFFVTYDCKTRENRDAFYAALAAEKLGETCAAEKGCLKYSYFCPCDAEDKLFLLEEWETLADQKLHTTQPHFARIGALKAQFGAVSSIQKLSAEVIA